MAEQWSWHSGEQHVTVPQTSRVAIASLWCCTAQQQHSPQCIPKEREKVVKDEAAASFVSSYVIGSVDQGYLQSTSDSDSSGTKTWETVKKPKASAAQLRKKAKKESKKRQQGLG